ncbi:MAG: relaxase domain-containing protein [Alphaproteobacteria bacterium]|nr:relaxase domain-containing protein [Alphaproteobacteria bacterium]
MKDMRSRADEREAIERAVIDAARRAIDDTIFRHCATTRVGAGGLCVETGNMLAATFLHCTSHPPNGT